MERTLFLPSLFLVIFVPPSVWGLDYRYSVFKPKVEGMYIASHGLSSLEVRSEIECARACVRNTLCTAISYECQKIESLGKGTCFLSGPKNSTDSLVIGNDASMCYFLLEEGQSVPSNDAPSTSSPGISRIIDLVEGIRNQCGPTSGSDIGIVTEDNLYFYDNANLLDQSPCKIVTDVHGFFSGFSALPSTDQWNVILTYQFNNVAVYANDDVYRWRTDGTTPLTKDGDYPKQLLGDITDLLGITTSNAPNDPIWSVYRNISGSNIVYFYNSDGQIYFYSDNYPYDSILQPSSLLTDLLGVSLNPWESLPNDVVGVALINGKDFLLVTSAREFYVLELDYNVLVGRPKTTLHYKGPITFA